MIVLDGDLIKYLDWNRRGISTMYGTWLDWLVKEFSALLDSKRKVLPAKVKSQVFTYWLLAPQHVAFGEDNMRRTRFNQSMESVVKQYESSMHLMRLKEFWDSADHSLVQNGSLTERGLDIYWKY